MYRYIKDDKNRQRAESCRGSTHFKELLTDDETLKCQRIFLNRWLTQEKIILFHGEFHSRYFLTCYFLKKFVVFTKN